MKLTDIFKFKLFDRTDKADLEVVNENFQSVEEIISEHKTSGDHDDRYLKKSEVLNTNIVTEAGYALDARQANPNVAGSLGAQISALKTNLKWSEWKTLIKDQLRYRYNAYNIEVSFTYWATSEAYSGHNSIKIAQMEVGPGTYVKDFVFLRNSGSGNLHYYAGIDFTWDGGIYLVPMGSDIPAGVILEAHFMLGR